jgi:hypothetical protein
MKSSATSLKIKANPPKLYIAMRCGRLANRLVIFTNLAAFAEEYGCRLDNFTFHTYAEHFENLRQNFYCRYPLPRRRSVCDVIAPLGWALRQTRLCYHVVRYSARWNERFGLFGKFAATVTDKRSTVQLEGDEIMGQAAQSRVLLFYGYSYRAPELVQRHADKIRAFFRPLKSIEEAAQQAVAELRRQADVVVGVHIRHGDYQQWLGGRYYYSVEKYAAWMRETVAALPGKRVAFMVASDGKRSVEEFPGLTVGFAPGSPVADIFALSGCDYLFGPPSTFSQWASFYGGRPIVFLRSHDAKIQLDQFQIDWLADHPQ